MFDSGTATETMTVTKKIMRSFKSHKELLYLCKPWAAASCRAWRFLPSASWGVLVHCPDHEKKTKAKTGLPINSHNFTHISCMWTCLWRHSTSVEPYKKNYCSINTRSKLFSSNEGFILEETVKKTTIFWYCTVRNSNNSVLYTVFVTCTEQM